MLKKIRGLIRNMGYDIVRYPYGTSLEGHIKRLLRENDINIVLDVGANVGKFGTMLRGLGYKGLIVSFEPVNDTFQELHKAAVSDERWKCYRLALGDEEGERLIKVAKGSDFSSFLSPNDYALKCFEEAVVNRQETVPVKRLDSIFGELTKDHSPSRIFLKIDTQGWDAHVLRGAQGCLDQIFLLQSELSVQPIYEGMGDWMSFITLVKMKGFDLLTLCPVNSDAEGRVIEFDALFKVCPESSTRDRSET